MTDLTPYDFRGNALAASIDALARNWTAAFGVDHAMPRRRLAHTLSAALQELVDQHDGLAALEDALDAEAEAAIRTWFEGLLDRSQPRGPAGLARLRLAFLHANAGGRYGADFLDQSKPLDGLASALEAETLLATPAPRPRRMPRQII